MGAEKRVLREQRTGLQLCAVSFQARAHAKKLVIVRWWQRLSKCAMRGKDKLALAFAQKLRAFRKPAMNRWALLGFDSAPK